MASITLDLPLPLGPTIDVKHWRGGRRRGREKESEGGEKEKESEGGEIERGRKVKQEKNTRKAHNIYNKCERQIEDRDKDYNHCTQSHTHTYYMHRQTYSSSSSSSSSKEKIMIDSLITHMP